MKKSTISIGVLVVGIVSVLAIRAYNKKKLDEYFEEESVLSTAGKKISDAIKVIIEKIKKALYDEVFENASKIIGSGVEVEWV